MIGDSIYEDSSDYGRYQVADVVYGGRRARLLYSGDGKAAQSGVPLDGGDMLFEYNQRFLELVRGLRPRRLLLIGGGAFTLPQVLASEFPSLRQDVVERDRLLLAIAKQYFDFRQTPNIAVHITDGRQFLDAADNVYDLILVDAFDHAVVPAPLRTVEAVRAMRRALRTGGVVAMNCIAAYYGRRSAPLLDTAAAMREVFAAVSLYPAGTTQSLWLPQNFILTATDASYELSAHLRYQPLAMPHADTAVVLHDEG